MISSLDLFFSFSFPPFQYWRFVFPCLALDYVVLKRSPARVYNSLSLHSVMSCRT